jgi:hypothetical protein
VTLRYLVFAWVFSAAYGQGFSSWPQHIRFEGAVVDFISGEPIPDVQVSASKCDRKTTTDAAGRFALECPYTIETVLGLFKPGYSLQGRQRLGIEGTDADGNPIRRQILRQMWAPVQISGQVVDANGQPAPNITLTAEPTIPTMRLESTKTGDDGRFKLQVPPASYRLCAVSEFDSIRERESPARIERMVSVSACFPSTRDRVRAELVTLKPAQNAGPLLIRLPRERTWSIAGRVLTRVPKTRDWTTRVWAVARLKGDAALPSPEFYRGRIDDETGRFVISGLRTGSYTLLVRAGPASQCYTCPMPPEYETRLPIQVNRDTKGVVATVRPFSGVTGRVVGEKGNSAPQTERLVMLDAGSPSRFSVAERISARIDVNGDFRIERVPQGTYLVVQNEHDSHLLRTVRQEGRPVAFGQIHVVAGPSPQFEIAFREAAATFTVSVDGNSDRWRGERLSVVAIPEDGWKDTSSWTGPIQVGTDSKVTIGVTRPGVYLVFATQNLAGYPVQDWADALNRKQQQVPRVTAPGKAGEVIALKPIVLEFGETASPHSK